MDARKRNILIISILLAAVIVVFYLIYQINLKKITNVQVREQQDLRKLEREKNIEAMKALLDQTAREIAASSTLQKQQEQNKKAMGKLLNATAKQIAASSTLQAEQKANIDAMRKLLEANSQ